MKKASFIPLAIAGLIAAAGCSDKAAKTDAPPPADTTMSQKAGNAADKVASDVKTAAINARDAVASKMSEWKLTSSDIKADLEKSGRVIRDKSAAIGEKSGEVISDARIVTVINAKLVGASDLSAFKINVGASKGVVILKGGVKSAELIGKALGLALDTDGVTQVVSELTVEESAEPRSM